MKETSAETKRGTEQGLIVFKCEADEFKKFISSLLGKPQTIGKARRGCFDIGLKEIQDLHFLINQRISQQNENALIQFTALIVFEDGSSVLLNSFDDLMTYKEVRPLASTQIHLTWEYLVTFQDRSTPEKQQIEVSFLTSTLRSFPVIDDDEAIVLASPPKMRAGMVTFRIKHTARTWGADMEALLSGHLENVLQTQLPLRKFVWRHSDGIAFTVGSMFFAVAVAMSFLVAAHIRHLQQNKVTRFLEERAMLEQKIDFMLTSVASGVWATYFFSVIVFLIVSLFVAVLLGAWVGSTADTDKPSFVVLTREAEKQREVILKRYQRRWALFILSLIVSLCTGVFANVIFQALWQ